MTCNLKDLPKKVEARIVDLQGDKTQTQYLKDMGIQNNVIIKLIEKLFFGSNYIVEIDNEYLVLRKCEAQCLKVTTLF